jgi:hypothetical protein
MWTADTGLVESQRKNFKVLDHLAPCWYAWSWLRDPASYGATRFHPVDELGSEITDFQELLSHVQTLETR